MMQSLQKLLNKIKSFKYLAQYHHEDNFPGDDNTYGTYHK